MKLRKVSHKDEPPTFVRTRCRIWGYPRSCCFQVSLQHSGSAYPAWKPTKIQTKIKQFSFQYFAMQFRHRCPFRETIFEAILRFRIKIVSFLSFEWIYVVTLISNCQFLPNIEINIDLYYFRLLDILM